ncbi:MAG: hypothetical protein AB7O38_09310 [Pirellulaceae bacterium]
MTQRELDYEVARATGESLAIIAGMGFVPLTRGPVEQDGYDDAREPLTVDWDELEGSRVALFSA